jgi:hypothetical protein
MSVSKIREVSKSRLAAEYSVIMVMKWRDKREVSFIPCGHKQQVLKPQFIRQYILAVGKGDLKD